jgi:hypothetical protein
LAHRRRDCGGAGFVLVDGELTHGIVASLLDSQEFPLPSVADEQAMITPEFDCQMHLADVRGEKYCQSGESGSDTGAGNLTIGGWM